MDDRAHHATGAQGTGDQLAASSCADRGDGLILDSFSDVVGTDYDPEPGRRWLAGSGHDPAKPLSVFGYGSLMWNPGFRHERAVIARVHGYHRRFCVYSHRYRGTPEAPGLVLGLDLGGSCKGVAFTVAPEHALPIFDYLWHREMLLNVYRPRFVAVTTADGASLNALTFVVRRQHRQYCSERCLDQAAGTIAHRAGPRGPNYDYLHSTVTQLRRLSIKDRQLEALLTRVEHRRAVSGLEVYERA